MHPCPKCGQKCPSLLGAAEHCDPCPNDGPSRIIVGGSGEAVTRTFRLTKESPSW